MGIPASPTWFAKCLCLWWKGNSSVVIYEYPVLTSPHEQNGSIQKENERKSMAQDKPLFYKQ